jgi:hypothetical protein
LYANQTNAHPLLILYLTDAQESTSLLLYTLLEKRKIKGRKNKEKRVLMLPITVTGGFSTRGET